MEVEKFLRISVILAVYNGEVSIAEAIESILNQTYKDFEFIIIDDGSKDSSYDIIKKYAIKDNRIRLLHNLTNMGLTKTLNRAIKLYKIRLKAINLNKKLIIFNKPSLNQMLETYKRKFIIQMKNGMVSAITYLRYAENKFGGIKAIFLYIINSCYSIFYPKRSKVIK